MPGRHIGAVPVPVCAVVVAYEAPEVLRACLEGICAQDPPPQRVVVVDNGRRRPVADHVDLTTFEPTTIDLIVPGENLGPAGGFARGLEAFLAGDEEFAWVM